MLACAEYFGMTKDSVQYRVKFGDDRVFPEKRQYALGAKLDNWKIPIDLDMALEQNGRKKGIDVRRILNGNIYRFNTSQDAARFLKVSAATISNWLRLSDQPVLPGMIQLKLVTDPSPWREIANPWVEYMKANPTARVVRCVHTSTGKEKIFESLTACAAEMGLKITAVAYRLSTGGKVTFNDGYRYSDY